MPPSEAPRSSRRFLRPSLRQATFVLPQTGQRLKGLVSLRSSTRRSRASSSDENDEQRGLISGEIEADHEEATAQLSAQARKLWAWLYQFLTSEHGIGILKCSLAYLLGSLATFIPAISTFLGHQEGKHMVATVTVYFHPARSQGSMYRALICALLAFGYAAFLSITSMLVESFFQDTLDQPAMGHALVLIVFCGGGLGFVGWTKQRLGDPLVNVACSLTALSTITILTKEGSVQSGDLSLSKISQVLKMVLMGVIAAMTVSFLIFPISARKKLRANLVTVTDTLAVMLAMITESFLSGSEEELTSTEFVDAETKHRKAYSQLDKLVKEAKLEHFVAGTEKEYRLEKRLVRWVQDITHNMGGLHSAANLQFSLIRETLTRESASSGEQSTPITGDYFATLERSWSFPDGSFLEPIAERPEEELSPGGNLHTPSSDANNKASFLPADVFTIFISHLGPSMRSLAFTLKEIFKEIPFGPAPTYKVSVDSRLRMSLDRALDLYRESRQKTLKSLYQQTEAMKLKTPEAEADLEEVSASCGHFSFSLLEFGEQLHQLLAILDELQLEAEERPNGRSWSWMNFWQTNEAGMADADLIFNRPENLRHVQLSRAMSSNDRISASVGTRLRPTLETTIKERLGYRLWKSLEFFRRDDTKYAIKVGTGAALYALPAFVPSTRPFYQHWRGEWGLLSYMLVCSMTIGASNTTGYARFFGTCLGALCAILSWHASNGNVFGLAFMGWLMATWTAWITIVRGNGPMGRFIMLTYNLSVLYAYSLAQKEADDSQDEGGQDPVITEIALHRVVAVLSGCVWGIIITRLIWPISARDRLKEGLSILWLRLGLVWKRDPLSTMARTGRAVVYMTVREKLELERFLSRLESLQVAARSEFELRSAFADSTYGNILRRTRSTVNAFHAMNLELMKSDIATEGEVSLLQYTTVERQQLSARISHLLTVMASSMRLEYPLGDVLPSIDHARDRLLARIYRYRQDHEASQITTDEDCSLLYAYILVTGQLSKEITEIIAEIGQLFGVLNPRRRWFRAEEVAVSGGGTARRNLQPPSILFHHQSIISQPLSISIDRLRTLPGILHECVAPIPTCRPSASPRRAPASPPAMQIDPAALSRTDSASNPAKSAAPNATATVKSSRALISVPRLDLEHAYTDLKAAIGDKWAEYKESTALFLLGHYNQNEYASRVDHILCADSKIEHLHNNFVCAIIGNLTRDLPDHGVANWVSANDKPSMVSKPVSGDAAEQRLKTEVMQLPPRDRRRIKGIPERDPTDTAPNELDEYHLAKQIKLPSQVPASAGGLNKTNWELEIRKRYAQPLAAETGEFPDAESIHARMVPMCYEESLPSGAGLPCAEFMAIATETFVKEVLSAVFSRTRSNGPSGTINGMMMRKYRQQLELEELSFTRGEITKDTATGLLPVEAKEASVRRPLGVRDLRLTLELAPGVLGHMPLIIDQVMGGYFEDELETEKQDRVENGVSQPVEVKTADDEMDVDDVDDSLSDWEGGTAADREQLGTLLDECLSLAA
ncbi:Transcriptional coactivator SAGA-type complex Ada1/Tada1 [Penicillium hispanicum]|uniref:Transcriptional coactivator SAGA-type complex Ada1/Tada1 n=1 Tax=Penicillium hispanicum TaxID=1080232 RepID=UPI0025401BC9|nr:Transcriptional coactivator SAGA-type complex Ada1/Tada1 [Penicillium hispanicum]KAJ5585374.1 Transcriptional coactivator SAGA-type complex Ada1/Tada1 [Penicillium hispanicum]